VGEPEVSYFRNVDADFSEERINEKYVPVIERRMKDFLGHNLVFLAGPRCVSLAMSEAERVEQEKLLTGCRGCFLYSRISFENARLVDGELDKNFNAEEKIERGLKKIVENWNEKFNEFLSQKSGFVPHVRLSSSEDKTYTTICVAAYFE